MLQAWREYLMLTQAEMAARMGITQAGYAQIEAAKRPRKATLQKAAEALGITLEQLAELCGEGKVVPDGVLLPVDLPLQHLPALHLNRAETRRLQQGQVVVLAAPEADGIKRVYCDSAFIGMAEVKGGNGLSAKRLLSYSTTV